MKPEGVEYGADTRSRAVTRTRQVKLPGEARAVQRSDSAMEIARKIQVEKRERRLREMERKLGR